MFLTVYRVIDLQPSGSQNQGWVVEIDIEADLVRGRPRGARGIWASRGVLFALIARDMTSRYRRTVLGATWAIVQPLLFTVIISLVHKVGSSGGHPVVHRTHDAPSPAPLSCALDR